jgi:hypothetical protein
LPRPRTHPLLFIAVGISALIFALKTILNQDPNMPQASNFYGQLAVFNVPYHSLDSREQASASPRDTLPGPSWCVLRSVSWLLIGCSCDIIRF